MIDNTTFKPFKTLDEQVEYLSENKNITGRTMIKKALLERPYISIINPYKTLFASSMKRDKTHIYNEEIEFVEYLKLVKSDDVNSSVLFKMIGLFERKLKFIIASSISERMTKFGDINATNYQFFRELLNRKLVSQDINELGFISLENSYSKNGSTTCAGKDKIEARENVLKKIIDSGNGELRSKNQIVLL